MIFTILWRINIIKNFWNRERSNNDLDYRSEYAFVLRHLRLFRGVCPVACFIFMVLERKTLAGRGRRIGSPAFFGFSTRRNNRKRREYRRSGEKFYLENGAIFERALFNKERRVFFQTLERASIRFRNCRA